MRIIHVFTLVVLLIAAVMLLCLGVLFLERKFPRKDVDERQQIAQGNAFRAAFFALQMYLIVVLCLDHWMEGFSRVSMNLLVLGGFVLGLIVYDTYCMFTNASLPLGEYPGKSALTSGILSGLWFFQFFVYLDLYTSQSSMLPMTEEAQFHWIRLILGVAFGYQAIAYLVQLLRERKGAE